MKEIQDFPDQPTADAFANSWNNLPQGSVYNSEQISDWLFPLEPQDFRGKSVLELGCGNGSILLHIATFGPKRLVGIDLGSSVLSAKANLSSQPVPVDILQQDLISFNSTECFDVAICIGVLHHLADPRAGFEAVLRNTLPGGVFHCWVYAYEGNWPVRLFVEPLRKISCRLPWWITKYVFASTLASPVWLLAKLIARFPYLRCLPLGEYLLWLSRREWTFARHVVFDQLVTPRTTYLKKGLIEKWLSDERIATDSTYISFRNQNSWRFGGKRSTGTN